MDEESQQTKWPPEVWDDTSCSTLLRYVVLSERSPLEPLLQSACLHCTTTQHEVEHVTLQGTLGAGILICGRLCSAGMLLHGADDALPAC